jgi:hypothetical protein
VLMFKILVIQVTIDIPASVPSSSAAAAPFR